MSAGRIAAAIRRPGASRGLTAFVFLVIAVWYVAFAVQRYDTSHLYGDEPDYLFSGESVWEDGDLDLTNQYLTPDRHAFPAPLDFRVPSDGSPAPSNVIPTSGVLLIEPAAAIGGMLAVYLLFTAMNLASLVLLFLVLRRTFDDVVCALTIAVVGLTVPLAWHAAAIWSEVPALLAISIALLLAPRVGCSPRAATGVALALAALPWLHQKYMPLAFGLGIAMLLVRERRRLWWIVMAGPVLGFAGTVAFSYAVRGRWNFAIAGTTEEVSSAFNGSLNRFLRQPLAWFFDQTRGSLPVSPVWLLIGVGALFLLRFARGRRLLVMMVVGFAPYFLIYFWGPFLSGDSAPGRETLVAIPALAVLMAAGISALRGVVATSLAAALAVLSMAFTMRAPFGYGFDIMFNNVGRPKALDHWASPRFMPAEFWPQMTDAPGTWSVSALILSGTAVAGLIGLIYYASRLHASAASGRAWTLAGESEVGITPARLRAGVRAAIPRRSRPDDS